MKRILSAASNIPVITMAATISLQAATTFYVDPRWVGTQMGSASQPWTRLSPSAWSVINHKLAGGDVTVYFSALDASSGAEAFYDANGDGMLDGIRLTNRTDKTGSVLRLDGNSLYNSSASSPGWVSNSGQARCKVGYFTAQNLAHAKHSNITIHGFHVATSGRNKAIAICGDNWIVEDCECEHTASAADGPGILLVPTADGAHEGSAAYAPPCTNIFIGHNIVHDTFGEALYIGGGGVMDGDPGAGYPSHSNVTIEGNRIYSAGSRGGQGDAIDVKGGVENLIISANDISGLNSGEVRAIVLQGQMYGASQSTLIERNWIHDCSAIEDAAIAAAGTWGASQGMTIRVNVISNVNASGIKIYASQDFVSIYNNTIFDCREFAILSLVSASIGNNLVFDNNAGRAQVLIVLGEH